MFSKKIYPSDILYKDTSILTDGWLKETKVLLLENSILFLANLSPNC